MVKLCGICFETLVSCHSYLKNMEMIFYEIRFWIWFMHKMSLWVLILPIPRITKSYFLDWHVWPRSSGSDPPSLDSTPGEIGEKQRSFGGLMKTPCHGDIIERSCDMYRNMVIYSIIYMYIYNIHRLQWRVRYWGTNFNHPSFIDRCWFCLFRFSTIFNQWFGVLQAWENPQKKTSSSSTAMIKVLANWSPRYHSCFIRHGIQRCQKKSMEWTLSFMFLYGFQGFQEGNWVQRKFFIFAVVPRGW